MRCLRLQAVAATNAQYAHRQSARSPTGEIKVQLAMWEQKDVIGKSGLNNLVYNLPITQGYWGNRQ